MFSEAGAENAALAHVHIQPAASKPAATETYSMRVPTESKVATTSVELEVPEGANVIWKVDIAPGQAQELTFVAKNPPTARKSPGKFTSAIPTVQAPTEWKAPAPSTQSP